MGKIIMNGNAYGSVGSDVEANPQGTATDTLNTIGIDNVIYEIQGGGGGGGNVDDVYVNGASVLDSSHIAQITSYKEVTKAQYDAIPNKDNDNILYCITDEGEVIGDNFNPIIYSLSEREVGTWIDGKPLYQKTFNKMDVVLSDNSWTNSILGTTGIAIKQYEGYFALDGYTSLFSYEYYRGSSEYFTANINSSGDINVRPNMNAGVDVLAGIITIWYTKNSDVPGGGQYTSLGIPAVHYSTDEQVIGTWIDGSTIYQKIFILSNPITIRHDSTVITDIDFSYMKSFIDCKGIYEGTGEEQVAPITAYRYNNQVYFAAIVDIALDKFIIQYTKITN